MASTSATAHGMRVFPSSADTTGNGGNPTVIFLNAGHLADERMRELAHASKHECGYVVAGPTLTQSEKGDLQYDVSIRYWVPEHEMEMCGHATIGALWLMDALGMFPGARDVAVSTKAGTFEAVLPSVNDSTAITAEHHVMVAQPKGLADELSSADREAIAHALGISVDLIGSVQNAATSRIKTLVELKDIATLDALHPEQPPVRAVCEAINSTGLYPYARIDDSSFSARQFPKSSGYLEDPATGIAATSLVCGLLSRGVVKAETVQPISVRQGWAMGMPSEIQITLRRDGANEVIGYWLSGSVTEMEVNEAVKTLLVQ
ncbi:phenazine biosynthesis-like protein [Sarocladium implicatum]|nr:phenazine biosynthesis-like protein [Sarocladium implicatum]